MLKVRSRIVDSIIDKIQSGELHKGDKLPSQTSFIRQFGCSRSTAVNAMNELRERGWVTGRQGSGMYVSNQGRWVAPKEVLIVGEHLVRSLYYPFSEMMFHLNLGSIPIRYLELAPTINRFESIFHPGQAVIWVLPSLDNMPYMKHLKKMGLPQLLINRYYDGFDCVYTDYKESIFEGLSWLLIEAGRNIAFIARPADLRYPYHHDRIISFYEACFKLGANLQPDLILKKSFSDFVPDITNVVRTVFERPQVPRGFFFLNYELVLPFVLATSKFDKELGRDYSLVTYDTVPELMGKKGIAMLEQSNFFFLQEIQNWVKNCMHPDAHLFRKSFKCELFLSENFKTKP